MSPAQAWCSMMAGRLPPTLRGTVSGHWSGEAGPIPVWPVHKADPLLARLRQDAAAIDVEKLALDSPLLRALRAARVNLSLPLVSGGRPIGLLNLGPRPGGNDQAEGNAIWVLRLAPDDATNVWATATEGTTPLHESLLARAIEESLLPGDLPVLRGWELAARFIPADEVGGDFYDFIPLPDGRLGILMGDATERGLAAALVMAVVRSVLRSVAAELVEPAPTLARANDLICSDNPTNTFATCFYAVLDPASGRLCYANAGHALPLWRRGAAQTGQVSEIEAWGSPLGWFPGATYGAHEVALAQGDALLLYSDGLVEARDGLGEMFGTPRLAAALAAAPVDVTATDALVRAVEQFTGRRGAQDDDLGLVYLVRAAEPRQGELIRDDEGAGWRQILAFQAPSVLENERHAVLRIVRALRRFHLPARRQEAVQTAVAEAIMNAVEHGNQCRRELPVSIEVFVSRRRLLVQVTDCGPWPFPQPAAPDLVEKLAGRQSARGWGRHLIRSLADEVSDVGDASFHTIRMIWRLKERGN